MKTFTKEWKRYLDTVYPEGTTDEQRKQVYLAFHAGAISMFAMMCEIASDGDDTQAERTSKMSALRNEIRQNCELINEGLEETN